MCAVSARVVYLESAINSIRTLYECKNETRERIEARHVFSLPRGSTALSGQTARVRAGPRSFCIDEKFEGPSSTTITDVRSRGIAVAIVALRSHESTRVSRAKLARRGEVSASLFSSMQRVRLQIVRGGRLVPLSRIFVCMRMRERRERGSECE